MDVINQSFPDICLFDKRFEKAIRKSFIKGGWSLSESMVANFAVERDRIHAFILLGTDLYERGFPAVDVVYTKKLTEIRRVTPSANILVVVRDRDTLSCYDRVDSGAVSILLFDDFRFVDYLKVNELATARTDDDGWRWAVGFAAGSPPLCRRLTRQAGVLGSAAHALFWAEKAVAADSRDPLNHYELAGARLLSGEIESAEEAIGVAIKLLPGSALLLSRASVIAARRGDRDVALAFAKRAVEADDCRAIDHHHLARLYLRDGAMVLAEAEAKEAIDLDPDNVQFQNTLADIRTRTSENPQQRA